MTAVHSQIIVYSFQVTSFKCQFTDQTPNHDGIKSLLKHHTTLIRYSPTLEGKAKCYMYTIIQ